MTNQSTIVSGREYNSGLNRVEFFWVQHQYLLGPEEEDDNENDKEDSQNDHHLHVFPPVFTLQSRSRLLELRSSLLKCISPIV